MAMSSVVVMDSAGSLPCIPRPVLATAKMRLEVERQDRTSLAERETAELGVAGAFGGLRTTAALAAAVAVRDPIAADLRAAALAQADKDLVAQGLLDKVRGSASAAAKERFGWKRSITLPTPGLLVRGCLDDCNVCEPELEREIQPVSSPAHRLSALCCPGQGIWPPYRWPMMALAISTAGARPSGAAASELQTMIVIFRRGSCPMNEL
jgi:hypothetical protein